MAREFYDGATGNESEQQFKMPMYEEDYDFSSYGEEELENSSEDVFAPFDNYPHEQYRYPMYQEIYHRPYPYPIYPIYPMYPMYPIYHRYPRYEMYRHYPVNPRRRY